MKNIGVPTHQLNACNKWNFWGGLNMAMILLPDFKEFLKSLKEHDVLYLLLGDTPSVIIDMPAPHKKWIYGLRFTQKLTKYFFCLESLWAWRSEVKAWTIPAKPKIIRVGYPPSRLEITTSISGVESDECFQTRIVGTIDGVEVNVIDLENLKKNKKASGRTKDLADLEQLSWG